MQSRLSPEQTNVPPIYRKLAGVFRSHVPESGKVTVSQQSSQSLLVPDEMSMVVHMTEETQRNSDAEFEREEDNYSDKVRNSPPPVPREQREPTQAKRRELIHFDSSNAHLQQLFALGEYDACKSLIGEMQETFFDRCEFAFFIRGTIARHEGDLNEALVWFNKAIEASMQPQYNMEIGRVYFLQGKHKMAVEHLEKAVKAEPDNWKYYYWLAMSIYHLETDLFNPIEKARDLLMQCPVLQDSAPLIVLVAKYCEELGDTAAAVHAYKKAMELEPENLDTMFKLGQVYLLRMGNDDAAFSLFGKALSYQPTHERSILAAGSIMQVHSDNEVALNKYRTISDKISYSGPLWNNIGMCFYAKQKYAAAHSCLKKAAFLSPLDYKINFNLALVHNAMGMYCSAMHFVRAASELRRDNQEVMCLMGVVLANLKDYGNARRAYEKTLSMGKCPSALLNLAILEFHEGNTDKAKTIMNEFVESDHCHQRIKKKASLFMDILNGETTQAGKSTSV